MTKEPQKESLIPFKKLSPDEVKALRSLASLKILNPGDILFREDEAPDTIFIILNGKIKITGSADDSENDIVFSKGEWVSEICFPVNTGETLIAKAINNASVLAINKNAIHELKPRTQLHFFHKYSDLSNERARKLGVHIKHLQQKNRQLTASLYTVRSRTKADFRHMELIRSIIKTVPRLPAFAGTLTRKLMDDKLSASHIADEVMKDPSLVGSILKTINSAYYGFEKQISDMQYAIVMLGFDSVYQIAMAEGIKRTMPDTPVFKELHIHSVIISQIAYTLSQQTGACDPSELATIGLLHDLGQVVVQLLKEKYPKFSMFIKELDRSQMGSLLLRDWNLPDIIWESSAFQTYPEFSTPENIPNTVIKQVTILYIAHLCYDVFRGQPQSQLPTIFLRDYFAIMNWPQTTLNEIIEDPLLPALIKNYKTFPAPMRLLLKKHIP